MVAVVVATALWRAYLVPLGPDPDSDSYGHHVIARSLLERPDAHFLHWVWLPLFHWIQMPLIAVGGTMQWLRWINVALWAAVPALLYWTMRQPGPQGEEPSPAPVAALAAVLAALCPIGMQMGTTAQPEPGFALLVLGVAAALRTRRTLLATGLLTAAVLLRYEAWAVLAALGAREAWRVARRRDLRDPDAGYRPLALVVVPGLAVLAWALVRLPYDQRLFGFVLDTRKFANDALRTTSAFEAGVGQALRDTLYYVYDVGRRVFDLTIVLVPLGLWRLGRRHPILTLVGGACLGFVTLTWVMRGTLGLDRHFVSFIATYAAAMAIGAEVAGEGLGRVLARRAAFEGGARGAFGVIAVAAVLVVYQGLDTWMGHWRGAIEGSYHDRIAVADFLRERVPGEQTIVCDEATVEVLSGLERQRFERRNIDRADVRAVIDRLAHDQGEVYVASWLGKVEALPTPSTLVFRPEGAPEDGGLAVVRIAP